MGQAKLFKRLRKEALLDKKPIDKRRYTSGAVAMVGEPDHREYKALKQEALAARRVPPMRKAWPVSLTKLRQGIHQSRAVYPYLGGQFPGKLRVIYGN